MDDFNKKTGTIYTTVKSLNSKTNVLSRLVAAVERNTGNDKNADWAKTDGHWYNEAYSGITVAVYTTEIKIDLGSTSERITVLDPKLAPQISSKAAQNTTAHSLQYKTTLDGSDDTITIGIFKGTPVRVKHLDLLFTSNKF